MGAVVAANVAAGFPARVATATLLAGPFFADSATFARMTVPWITALERGEGLTAFLVWLFPGTSDSIASGLSAQLLAQNDMGSLLAVMRSMGALVVSRDRGIATPVPALVVVGTGDPLLPQSRDLASWWPRSRLLEVAGASHVTVLADPQVLRAIRALIRTRTSSRGDRPQIELPRQLAALSEDRTFSTPHGW